MITRDEALRLLGEATEALEPVELPLDRALALGLAEGIVADRDAPPSDRSAMDGYAVRAADVTRAGAELELAGEMRAGQPAEGVVLEPGHAMRIMTGAVVPHGADSVIMVERARESEGGRRVAFDHVPSEGEHVRRRAEDRRRGEPILDAGRPVGPAAIAALTTVGRSRVRVHRRPRAAVLATGDELVDAGACPRSHQVRNSNGPSVTRLLAGCGADACDLGLVRDDAASLDEALEHGLQADLLCVSGGVSVGRYDLVRGALERHGMRVLFHKVAIKPGKPLLAGTAGKCLVLGLPGNPVSSFVTGRLFAVPILRRLMGYRRWRDRPCVANLVTALTMRPGRETFHLTRLEHEAGGLAAHPVDSRGSGDVLSLGRADGLIATPADSQRIEAGSRVDVLPFETG